ncbi:MAG: hypothetical protein JRN67_10840 [Nitrososphaerota archaeon]|nr:hypothetical protein [Nitrososphaerota archaeon]
MNQSYDQVLSVKTKQKQVQTQKLRCDKCGKQASCVIRVKRITKGRDYWYDRFLHYDKRKASGRRYCYVSIEIDEA